MYTTSAFGAVSYVPRKEKKCGTYKWFAFGSSAMDGNGIAPDIFTKSSLEPLEITLVYYSL